MGLSERLRAIRFSLRLTQAEMADQLGVSNSFLSEIEKGKTKPGYEFLFNIYDIFDVSLNYLLKGKGDMFCGSGTGEYVEIEKPDGQIDNINQILWYTKRSRLVKHSFIGMASRFILENIDIIRKELKAYEAALKKKEGAAPPGDSVNTDDTADKGETIDNGGKV